VTYLTELVIVHLPCKPDFQQTSTFAHLVTRSTESKG
jgi:hypothetical protein